MFGVKARDRDLYMQYVLVSAEATMHLEFEETAQNSAMARTTGMGAWHGT